MDLLKMFQNDSKTETFTNGQAIFKEGNSAEIIYVVIEGQVEVEFNGHVLETVEPGGIIGEMALVDNSPRSATAVAKTDCKVTPVDERRFTFLDKEHPYFAKHIMSVMANRLRRQTV